MLEDGKDAGVPGREREGVERAQSHLAGRPGECASVSREPSKDRNRVTVAKSQRAPRGPESARGVLVAERRMQLGPKILHCQTTDRLQGTGAEGWGVRR